jgi:hypothetical protein
LKSLISRKENGNLKPLVSGDFASGSRRVSVFFRQKALDFVQKRKQCA